MRKIVIIFLWFVVCGLCLDLKGQELNCNLTVSTPQIEGTNKQVFQTLENDLEAFMNSYRWTDLVYADDERIDCNMMITVSNVEDDKFTCELQVQASRPVYGSSYTTNLLNIRDKEFTFTYKEFDPIDINKSTFESNLTAVMAYYAYLIIGFDLDSYSRLGGQAAFATAEQIVNMCQSRSDESEVKGWHMELGSQRNRYSIISNIMDDRFKPLREFYYEYHRLALDNMATNVDNSRAKIAEQIGVLRDLNRQSPSAPLIITFLDAKNDELINIFAKRGLSEEKKLVHEILTSVNPTLSNRYDEILK